MLSSRDCCTLSAFSKEYASVNELGSDVVTSKTSGQFATKSRTLAETPAPVSMSMISATSSSSVIFLNKNARCRSFRLFMATTPDPPDINPISKGPCVMMSEIFMFLYTTSFKVCLGTCPNMTSTFASPKSASKTITFLPRRDNATARFVDTEDLPTPPLPLVMAMTLEDLWTWGSWLIFIIFLSGCA